MNKDKTTKHLFYFLTGIGILNFIGIIFVFPILPDQIPLHWGINGNIDNWGNKNFIFLFGILPIIVSIGMYLLPKLDPKKANYSKMSIIYSGFSIWLILFLILLCWLTIGAALNVINHNKVIPIIICLIIGLSFIVFGNYMPRIKQNWFFGVKTPWALENKKNWMKTQRFSGRIFIFLGLLFILNGFFFNKALFILTVIVILISTSSIFYYSYYLYKKEISSND